MDELTCKYPVSSNNYYQKNLNLNNKSTNQEKQICEDISFKNSVSIENKTVSKIPSNINIFNTNKSNNLSSEEFKSNLDNSKITMDMKIKLYDKNGITKFSKNDIEGVIEKGKIQLNKSLLDNTINSLKNYKVTSGSRTTSIKDINFDNKNNQYVIDIKVQQNLWKLPIWDNFQVKLRVDNKSNFVAELDKNWIPDSKILDKLEETIKDNFNKQIPNDFKNIQLVTKKSNNKIFITPNIRNLEIPISKNNSVIINDVNAEKAKFNIDNKGNIIINLNYINIKASSDLNKIDNSVSNKKDSLDINIKTALRNNNDKEVYAEGDLNINLDKDITSKIKFKEHVLNEFIDSGEINNKFSVHLLNSNGVISKKSNSNILIKNANINNQIMDLKTSLKLEIDNKGNLIFEKENYDDRPLNLNLKNSGLEFMVNGSEYFPEMKKMILSAKESINLETFELHNDDSAKEITYLLAKKAAGLSNENPVEIKFIFNSWKGDKEKGKESEEVIKSSISKVKKEILDSDFSEEEKSKLINNIDNNFKWKFFTDGILRSDHRKVLVIDGKKATVGGMNIGSKYLSNNAYHDVMLKIAGPEVRNIQKEFLENWFEFNNLKLPNENEWNNLLKNENELNSSLENLQKEGKFKNNAKISTLVTDDKQNDIEKGIIKLINEAKREINIEQVFFSHSDINKALESAIKRGVNINIILAKDNLASDIFNQSNLYSVYNLVKVKKQGAKGNINLYQYENNTDTETKYIHTKAISVDKEKAIIGSANMINRSLSGLFKKEDNTQVLYNKELSIYIEDSNFVKEIDFKLFEKDMKENSKKLDINEIESLVNKLGGEKELKKKYLIAQLT